MTPPSQVPGVPPTFRAARKLLRWRPLSATGQSLRAMLVENSGGSPDDVDLAAPVVADLLAGAYLDLEAWNVGVTPATIKAWGVSFEAVLDAAGRHLPDWTLKRTTATHVGAASYVNDAHLAAAALLRPGAVGFLRGIRHPLVLVPTQSHLIVADADDPAAVDQALRLVLEAVSMEGARLVSRTPLHLTARGWEALTLPDTPFTRAVRHLFDAGVYAEARDLIKARHERLDVVDVIMPSYLALKRPEGGTLSRTSLTDTPDLRTFLPLADEVVLARDAGITVASMDRVRAIEGLATPVPGLLPPYLEVTRFPIELVADAPASGPSPREATPVPVVPPVPTTWDHQPADGPTLVFDTPEFAYAIVEELMYRQEVLTPKFDVFGFLADRGHDDVDPYESITIIPSVRTWFLELPIPAALCARVESLLLDGGTEIQMQLAPAWHGEDDQFDIGSLTAAELSQFPNLKTIDDNGFLSPAARRTVEASGITIT